MYVVTCSESGSSDVPVGAFSASNDMDAMAILNEREEEMVAKATSYYFGTEPDDVALWNICGSEPFCVIRKDLK